MVTVHTKQLVGPIGRQFCGSPTGCVWSWNYAGSHESGRVTPGDGRVAKSWSMGLAYNGDKGRITTDVCVDLSLRPDICSADAIVTEAY
jgi:hypothetical protein